jgi:hypothetical protein
LARFEAVRSVSISFEPDTQGDRARDARLHGPLAVERGATTHVVAGAAGSACVDYLQVMPLVAVASGLWSVTHTMRFPGGVRIPTRMSVARLGGDGLWVHSAVPIDDALAAEIAVLGKVLYVVAPNCFHHLHIGSLLARFPEAKLFGAPGLAQKRADLPFAGALGEGSSVPWVATIDQIVLEGAPKLNEVVFFHRASRSLLVTDLFFNMMEPETWATGMVLRMMGTYKRFGPSRAWRFYCKDRKALKASVEKVLAWDFVRVLPAHGAVFEADDAREQSRWFLA